MTCPICLNLKRAYDAALTAYLQARSSASFSVCPKVAAHKNVDMERTRYELEEHRLVCAFAGGTVAFAPRAEQVYELETSVA
jgi:hypothetical protein